MSSPVVVLGCIFDLLLLMLMVETALARDADYVVTVPCCYGQV